MAREATVENRLKERIEEIGGACEKHVGGKRGDPDRICSFPNGYHCLAETKWLADVKPEDHQLRRHGFWGEHGMDVGGVGCNDHIEQLIGFALVQPPRLSVGGGPIPGKPATRHVGSGPWIGKNRNKPFGPGHAEVDWFKFLPSTGAGTEKSRGRGLVRGER